MVDDIRVAFGTGVLLGFWRGQLTTPPTTAHFLTYHNGRCNANCKFCPQAHDSTTDLRMLSRVLWPRHQLGRVIVALGENSNEFKRVCVQAVNYPHVVDDICEIVKQVRSACDLPISVSCQPLGADGMKKLSDEGVERVSVALDAATPELFYRTKGGCYTWGRHLEALENAKTVFGDRVSTHLIAGLGENEEEMVRAIQFLHNKGVTIGLFAFTPIDGTFLSNNPRPDVASYRRIQLARHLIVQDMISANEMSFEHGSITSFGIESNTLGKIIESGEPFRTSGCPGCNRPFYNESPRGPIYNYPKKPSLEDLVTIQSQLGEV